MADLFDYVKAINETKVDMFLEPQADAGYLPFIVNKALSNFIDTVLYANEMNRCNHLSKKMQFHFLLHTVPKGKRYGWSKKDKETSSLLLVKEYYKYSNEKAKQALSILSDADLDIIEQKMYKGGR